MNHKKRMIYSGCLLVLLAGVYYYFTRLYEGIDNATMDPLTKTASKTVSSKTSTRLGQIPKQGSTTATTTVPTTATTIPTTATTVPTTATTTERQGPPRTMPIADKVFTEPDKKGPLMQVPIADKTLPTSIPNSVIKQSKQSETQFKTDNVKSANEPTAPPIETTQIKALSDAQSLENKYLQFYQTLSEGDKKQVQKMYNHFIENVIKDDFL